MTDTQTLASGITERFGDAVATSVSSHTGELTVVLQDASRLLEVATALRDDFGFEIGW